MDYRTAPAQAQQDEHHTRTLGIWTCPGCSRKNSPLRFRCERCSLAQHNLGIGDRSWLLALTLAIDTWAKSQAVLQGLLSSLVTLVKLTERPVERLLTEVRYRTLVEMHAPTEHLATTSSRVAFEQVTPFAYAPEELREVTEHVAECSQCAGGERCGACDGRGRITCHDCSGAGIVEGVFNEHRQQEPCPVCHGSGQQVCASCGREPHQACDGCKGTRRQLVWLVFNETSAKHLVVEPHDATDCVAGIAQAEPLDDEQCQVLDASVVIDEPRAIAASRLGERASLLGRAVPAHDAHDVVIMRQQYVRFLRHNAEAVYQLAGESGTMAFEGGPRGITSLRGPQSAAKRWRWLRIASTLVAGVVSYPFVFAYLGEGAYFSSMRAWLILPWVASSLLLARPLSAVLRSVGHGPRRWFSGVRTGEWITGALGVICAITNWYPGAWPSLSEFDEALQNNDRARAMVVLSALDEYPHLASDVREAHGRIALVEALALTGDEQLHRLCTLQQEHGEFADEAHALCYELLRARATDDPARLVRDIDELVPDWQQESELRDIMTEAFEAADPSCKSDLCRLRTWGSAPSITLTPVLRQRADALRASLTAAMRLDTLPAQLSERVWREREVIRVARDVTSQLPSEKLLREKAALAEEVAVNDLRAVPMLGNDVDLTRALLEPEDWRLDGHGLRLDLGDTKVHVLGDARRRCVGVVFSRPTLAGNDDGLGDRWLSQALGKPAKVEPAQSGPVRWVEQGTPVEARWSDGRLVELRVGTAARLARPARPPARARSPSRLGCVAHSRISWPHDKSDAPSTATTSPRASRLPTCASPATRRRSSRRARRTLCRSCSRRSATRGSDPSRCATSS